MEGRLGKLFRLRGAEHVNSIRGRAREIAQQLDMQDEYEKPDDLIGSLQGTRDTNIKTDIGKAVNLKNRMIPIA